MLICDYAATMVDVCQKPHNSGKTLIFPLIQARFAKGFEADNKQEGTHSVCSSIFLIRLLSENLIKWACLCYFSD